MDEIEKAPLHAFELRITISASTWEFARRAAKEIAAHLEEREPNSTGISSGSYDGAYSIDLTQRDITPEAYRDELEAWRQRLG